jgi:hypothetical protein
MGSLRRHFPSPAAASDSCRSSACGAKTYRQTRDTIPADRNGSSRIPALSGHAFARCRREPRQAARTTIPPAAPLPIRPLPNRHSRDRARPRASARRRRTRAARRNRAAPAHPPATPARPARELPARTRPASRYRRSKIAGSVPRDGDGRRPGRRRAVPERTSDRTASPAHPAADTSATTKAPRCARRPTAFPRSCTGSPARRPCAPRPPDRASSD